MCSGEADEVGDFIRQGWIPPFEAKDYVPWDSKKVALKLRRMDEDYGIGDDRHDYLKDADQLHKILTGGD